MHEVNIEIKNVAAREDIQRWEDHMLVKAKCWNQFCDGLYCENEIRAVHVVGLYCENEIRAVHVVKEDNADITYLTTLCEDCIKYTRSYGVLVKEKYLMIEPRK